MRRKARIRNRRNFTVRKLFIALAALLCCAVATVTVSLAANDTETYLFRVIYDGTDGNAYADQTEGYYEAGTELTAHAVPADGFAFYAWTIGGTYDQGGIVVSYDKDYTFTAGGNAELYANFRSHDTALVLYHANGGTVTETGEDTLWDDFSMAYFLYPNTLAEMGYFENPGYTLIGYNTEPDNSGTFYNVGGKAFEDTTEVIELYCIWSPQDSRADFAFEYNDAYDGYYVVGYFGTDTNVSIPSEYDDKPVVGIAQGAFTGCETMEALVIPSTVRDIQDFSVNDCPNLSTMILFDSLDYLSDDSFDNDENLNHVYFSAATSPVFTTWFNNHAKKVEIIAYWAAHSEKPIMVCQGGSSTAYAIDAEQLQEQLAEAGYDYLVLNCGSNGANLFNMTSDWAMHFMREGDFFLQVIEYSYWQLGGVQCRWESFRSFESCYNVFSWVRASKYNKLYDSFCSYLDARKDMTPSEYENYTSTLAPNGYYDDQGTLNVITRPNGASDFWSGRSIYFDGNEWLYNFMIYYCNVQYSKFDALGIDYAMAYTPLNRNSLYSYQTDQGIDDFEAYLRENLNIDVIGDLQNYILDPTIFFDDDYHLAAPARADYTTMLGNDLIEYLDSLPAEDTAG